MELLPGTLPVTGSRGLGTVRAKGWGFAPPSLSGLAGVRPCQPALRLSQYYRGLVTRSSTSPSPQACTGRSPSSEWPATTHQPSPWPKIMIVIERRRAWRKAVTARMRCGDGAPACCRLAPARQARCMLQECKLHAGLPCAWLGPASLPHKTVGPALCCAVRLLQPLFVARARGGGGNFPQHLPLPNLWRLLHGGRMMEHGAVHGACGFQYAGAGRSSGRGWGDEWACVQSPAVTASACRLAEPWLCMPWPRRRSRHQRRPCGKPEARGRDSEVGPRCTLPRHPASRARIAGVPALPHAHHHTSHLLSAIALTSLALYAHVAPAVTECTLRSNSARVTCLCQRHMPTRRWWTPQSAWRSTCDAAGRGGSRAAGTLSWGQLRAG